MVVLEDRMEDFLASLGMMLEGGLGFGVRVLWFKRFSIWDVPRSPGKAGLGCTWPSHTCPKPFCFFWPAAALGEL